MKAIIIIIFSSFLLGNCSYGNKHYIDEQHGSIEKRDTINNNQIKNFNAFSSNFLSKLLPFEVCHNCHGRFDVVGEIPFDSVSKYFLNEKNVVGWRFRCH